ncbi:MAG: hypothetical protein JST11_03370 [Acidobacteria bacterium]|nr:hypothetical protein [Acidobacteriota bacterium]
MKILWCDDDAHKEVKLEGFLAEWNLSDRRNDVIPVWESQKILGLLRSVSDIGLVVVDLLWNQDEQVGMLPHGIKIIQAIREEYPDIRIATRSVISRPDVIAGLVQYFVEHRVSDHFYAGDPSQHAALRREVVVSLAERAGAKLPTALGAGSLRAYAGERWGIVFIVEAMGYLAFWEKSHEAQREWCNVISECFGRCADIVRTHGGFLFRVSGDRLTCVFVAPQIGGDHSELAEAAVEAARECRDLGRTHVTRFNQKNSRLLNSGAGAPHIAIAMEGGALLVHAVDRGSLEDTIVMGLPMTFSRRVVGFSPEYPILIGTGLRRELRQIEAYETRLVTADQRVKELGQNLQVFTFAR